MHLQLKTSTLPKLLICIISVLFILHCTQLIAYYVIADTDKFDFIELVDFDYEGNLPAFYSALALFIATCLLALISRKARQDQAPYKNHWMMLTLIFLWLMLDEALGLHEELGDFVESLQLFKAEGYLYFAWVVPYGMLLSVFFFAYLKFTLALPSRTRSLFITSGLIFITGAVGIETLSAREADLHGSTSIMYSVLYTIEELCEMLGIVLFIYALLDYIKKEIGTVQLTFQ